MDISGALPHQISSQSSHFREMGDELDLVQPWRKSFPVCKPPNPGDRTDAARFAREFEEGLAGQEVAEGLYIAV